MRNELKNAQQEVESRKGIKSIGVIVDLDNFDNSDVFSQLIDDFKLRHSAIKIIGYRGFYDKNSPYATPVFSDKDLGWGGDIENSYALEFLTKEYDLLINYYTQDKLMMQLMTVKTKARIKVGFDEVDKDLNDLILQTSLKDFTTFKTELKKYLKVMNEL